MLVGGLMPQNDVEELGKLPQLVQHFRYHDAQAPGQLKLGHFIAMHYGTSSAVLQCPPSADHNKLPLHGQHHAPNLEYVVPVACVAVPAPRPHRLNRRYQRPAAGPYAFAYRPTLLQPPRA